MNKIKNTLHKTIQEKKNFIFFKMQKIKKLADIKNNITCFQNLMEKVIFLEKKNFSFYYHKQN